MNFKIKKTTKNNSRRQEDIQGKEISYSCGHSDEFWWNIHFEGKDKNGLSVQVEVTMNEKERIEFLKSFEERVNSWKNHINSKK